MQFIREDHTLSHLSRNARKKARLKRDGSALLQQLQSTQQGLYNAHVTLLCVLAQQGNITCTQGTLDQVVAGVRSNTLNWRTRAGEGKEFIIEVVDKGQEAENGADTGTTQQALPRQDRVTITRLPDEEEASEGISTEAAADRLQPAAGGTGPSVETGSSVDGAGGEQRTGEATV